VRGQRNWRRRKELTDGEKNVAVMRVIAECIEMVQLHLMVGVRGVVIASRVWERLYERERERDFMREREIV
jgi:hypothetical protein